MNNRIIFIEGDNFSDLEGFYDEIDMTLTKDLNWKIGHNLNALNDLLRGGFGVHEYEVPIDIVWRNFNRSEFVLGKELVSTILEIIQGHKHINLIRE